METSGRKKSKDFSGECRPSSRGNKIFSLQIKKNDSTDIVIKTDQYGSIEELKDAIKSNRSNRFMVKTAEGGTLLSLDEIASFHVVDDENPLAMIDLPLPNPTKDQKEERGEITMAEQQKKQQPKNISEDLPRVGNLSDKRRSFREKFLDREAQGDNWENEIIEKQDKRIKRLQELAEALDKEDIVISEFIKDKLG